MRAAVRFGPAAPLARATLLSFAGSEAVFVLTIHHSTSSPTAGPRGVIIRDLVALYEADVAGRAPSLPPMEVQYSDFVAWQAERLALSTLGRAQPGLLDPGARWPCPSLNLPTDRYRGPVAMSYRGTTAFYTLPAELAQALRRITPARSRPPSSRC